MQKKHIIQIGSDYYSIDSVTAATQLVALLAKLTPCQHITEGDYDGWHYAPDTRRDYNRVGEASLTLNQKYQAPKPKKKARAKNLPAPARGSILCICEKSYVAPRTSCAHCGRAFSVSHNRTHSSPKSAGNIELFPDK